MSDYLTLEQAAAKLGITTEKLIDLRSQGMVRGFRDGTSWKFPVGEVDRLTDELEYILGGSGVGSGILVDDKLGSGSSSKLGAVIGGDSKAKSGGGSDLDIGGPSRPAASQNDPSSSDVNLVAGDTDGSDVKLVASGSGRGKPGGKPELLEFDSADLQLSGSALIHDSGELDVADQPVKDDSTGPIAKGTLRSAGESVLDEPPRKSSPGSSVIGIDLEEDSDDAVLANDSGLDMLDEDYMIPGTGSSSLELMSGLDQKIGKASDSGADVLSELDLLSAEQAGSGLISGIGSNLVTGSDVGSGSDLDDVLGDDDLVIADDDDDLVIDNAGSDISVAGDSGINLMSPSDSGLSLESEPLDLAGSSISALDLGGDLGSGSGRGGKSSGFAKGSGSAIDFQGDEEFQLSPSGIGLETDDDSGSQVIEIEDSEIVGEAVNFEDDGFGGGVDEPVGLADENAMSLDSGDVMAPAAVGGGRVYEAPYQLFDLLLLAAPLCVLALGGMIATDLVRNMWAYSEPAAPVSGLTDMIISLVGWDK